MKPSKVRRRLELAHANGDIVLLKRSFDDFWHVGFVAALEADWLLLYQLYDARFQGWKALRIADVTSVGLDRSFLPEALRRRGEGPRPAPALDLSDTRALLRSTAAHFPLVSVRTERVDDLLYIGRVAKFGRRSVTLAEIDRDAVWRRVEKTRYKDITCIDAGGPYEAALWQVGAESAPPTEYHHD